jgi:flagellar assembly protein FliH
MGASDRPFSRFIPKEQIAEAASWEFESLIGGSPAGGTGSLLSSRERRAYDRGRDDGFAAGFIAAQQRRGEHAAEVARMLAALRTRFDEFESRGADLVLDLALEIARQVVRREVSCARDAVLPALREAMLAVIEQHAQPRIYLHPRDLEHLRAELDADGSFRGARFVADATLTPGGCRIETHQVEVDASVETRWRRVLATLGSEAPFDESTR